MVLEVSVNHFLPWTYVGSAIVNTRIYRITFTVMGPNSMESGQRRNMTKQHFKLRIVGKMIQPPIEDTMMIVVPPKISELLGMRQMLKMIVKMKQT